MVLDEKQLREAERLIRKIRPLKSSGKFTPHKYLFLLALAKLYQEDIERVNQFPLNATLENAFRDVCSELLPADASQRMMIEYPYYHLASDSIWHFSIIPEKESRFYEYESSPNLRFTRQRLIETVAYAFLDKNLDGCFRDEKCRISMSKILREYVAEARNAATESERYQTLGAASLFRHEGEAISNIQNRVGAARLGSVLQNLEIHDPQSNRYFETDLVLISGFGVYVVELKHWSGRIEIRPNSWIQNESFYKPDPHKTNGFKAKLIRGLYERKFPTFPGLYFESVVVFTNPEVAIYGSSVTRTLSHNPTFENIDRFIDYLKHQRSEKSAVLRKPQVDAFANYLTALNRTPRPRDFVFPGYEIIERLYQHDDRAEVVARPTDVRHRRLSRLRIFFPPADGPETSRKVLHERATATLNAVAKIGSHPNILTVWAVPNEFGYIVEGSDWSETGTLRDYLDRDGSLSPERAVAVTTGILSGLEVVHRECVIHRALCPESIMMDGESPKLMNFDLSYQLEEERTTVIPDVAELKRSAYIAPEVYTGGSLMESADLFSVGVILYEMLTGERPFACSTDLEREGGHLVGMHQSRFESLGVPESLVTLVFDLVQLNPNARPSQVAEVLARLLAGSHQEPTMLMQVNPELAPGTTHDVYEIEKFVAKGAESQIYQAKGPRGRSIAIKLFNADVALSRILNEQESVATVRHSSIVRADNLHRWEDGRFYLPFEWISGRSLRLDIENACLPDIDSFNRTAVQLLEVLQALHSVSDENGEKNPILHNDIKPENILIDESGRAVLIDFGAASHPSVGLYEGSEGYVAPDLILGEDRCYSEDGDLYGLGVTLFEWVFGKAPYEKATIRSQIRDVGGERQTVPDSLIEWFRRAVATESVNRFPSAEQMKDALLRTLSAPPILREDLSDSTGTSEPPHVVSDEDTAAIPSIERLRSDLVVEIMGNAFVQYLNSLHSRDADSENALAESQARSDLFSLIHVPHPVTTVIEETLLSKNQHVILTGHAGDGKSTIGIELYKRLLGLSVDAPLDHDIPPQAEIESSGHSIVLVKDLSEWSADEQQGFLAEALEKEEHRFFIISNTGTLLDTFRQYEKGLGGDWAATESQILQCMESPRTLPISFHGVTLAVINLSMMDNLRLAEDVFLRMISRERWSSCEQQDCRDNCPIYRNVSLMQENEAVARRRIFLLYRRMYEYGTRLTLRQLTAHIAYTITSGLTCRDIVKMGQKARPPRMTDFMFFNRFFGDNGQERDVAAEQLPAIRQTRESGFGLRPCPSWERRLWARTRGEFFTINAQRCEDDFRALRTVGAGLKFDEEISYAQARLQVRRMVYFLNDFGEKDDETFVKTFLDSPMILDFVRWQEASNNKLSLGKRAILKRRVLHVLQEHYTGVRLPEGRVTDRDLFITMSRRSNELRQSAQVVLTRIPEGDLQLELVEHEDGLGNIRRELNLQGREDRIHASLSLELPFLDYIIMRNQGEVGSALLPSYVDRLDRFRGRLIKHTGFSRRDDIMLVRLRTNYTFRRQVFAVREDRLEVTDD